MQQRAHSLILFATILNLSSHHSQAQPAASTAAVAATTRAQVKMEREDFIKSHRWDPASETWVLRPEFEPPAGMKSRTEVRRDRDEFLKQNKWDAATESWIALQQPRQIGQLSRDQVRKETREFLRTHEWDDFSETWKLKRPIDSRR